MANDGKTMATASRNIGRALLLLILASLVLAACTRESWLAPLLTPGPVQPVGQGASQSATAKPAPSPVVAPTATANPAAASGTTFGLAWFHKPPDDGTTVQQMAAEHAYIHLTGASDVPYRNELRQAGYKGPIYTYMVAYVVDGPGPYKNAAVDCDASYVPLDNNFAWGSGDFCNYIHPHESWFLHNGQGERLVIDFGGWGHWDYLMNPADSGWQAFSYSRMRAIRDTLGYDGLWLDNLDLSLSRARSEMNNSDGRVKEFASDEAFRQAMRGWLTGARKEMGDWPIWANLIGGNQDAAAWDAYAPFLDGAMEESFAVNWLDGWLNQSAWASELSRIEQWQASGKGVVLVGQGEQDDSNRMRFTLASYMLVAQPGLTFFRYASYASYYRAPWIYPDFDTARALGLPTSKRVEIEPGIWRRDFSGGYVQVDLNAHSGKLVLK